MDEAPKISPPIVILFDGRRYEIPPDSNFYETLSTLIELMNHERQS